MNDITYTAYTLDRHRASDLARDAELVRRQREHGPAADRPRVRPLATWSRGAARVRRSTFVAAR